MINVPYADVIALLPLELFAGKCPEVRDLYEDVRANSLGLDWATFSLEYDSEISEVLEEWLAEEVTTAEVEGWLLYYRSFYTLEVSILNSKVKKITEILEG
jgi:hypothetical protein